MKKYVQLCAQFHLKIKWKLHLILCFDTIQNLIEKIRDIRYELSQKRHELSLKQHKLSQKLDIFDNSKFFYKTIENVNLNIINDVKYWCDK